MASWHDLGPLTQFTRPASPVQVGKLRLAVTSVGGRHGVISGACNHVGGPLGEGRCEGEYLVCPWHGWKYHVRTGKGEPGFEVDAVPSYPVREEGGHLWVDLDGATPRTKGDHPPHPLARRVERAPGPLRVVGISTTNMDLKNPRYSTSEALLEAAMDHARELQAETRTIRLAELSFRACEGYYSKSARACTWPCSITQMDPDDQLDRVYEALVHWADVYLLATPIRWGAPSALYSKMVERLNCIQNQVTIANRVLLKDKVAAFIITGGQDNVQAVAGQLMVFFGELGCHFPQFPFVAHSRGWSAEDMERNVEEVQGSAELRDGARMLAARAVQAAERLLAQAPEAGRLVRGGRKAHHLDLPARREGGEP
ncbi:MAG: NAD(P)H-dependent oxidoreductase [Anaeromyxobacter sp.]|nr:NAD(P)H-dependent oxidoreductase [Anaeromyxobacter sp.]MBL0275025.1 NAD(P)H-dependent oxidoreductase [Anaeromyxobacter sp.]